MEVLVDDGSRRSTVRGDGDRVGTLSADLVGDGGGVAAVNGELCPLLLRLEGLEVQRGAADEVPEHQGAECLARKICEVGLLGLGELCEGGVVGREDCVLVVVEHELKEIGDLCEERREEQQKEG